MAGLREMRKRLKSIRTTGQLAGAMRTAAAAKYARVNAALSAFQPYRTACREMRERLGGAGIVQSGCADGAPECLVLLSGNRGLCGGFHAELMGYVSAIRAAATTPPVVVACGKKAAAYCRENGLPESKQFSISDAPTYEEAHALSAYLRDLYEAGTVSAVTVVRQKFWNMLRQTPEEYRLLPVQEQAVQTPGGQADDGETLLLPDRETVAQKLAVTCFDAEVYALLLESAAGAQAATLMAMRSAYDNATESAAKLETAINRRRQAEVTASVIETSAENIQQ